MHMQSVHVCWGCWKLASAMLEKAEQGKRCELCCVCQLRGVVAMQHPLSDIKDFPRINTRGWGSGANGKMPAQN